MLLRFGEHAPATTAEVAVDVGSGFIVTGAVVVVCILFLL